MSGAPFGGYTRSQPGAAVLRLDLNEAPRETAELREALLAQLVGRPWRRYPDIDSRAAREAAAELYGWRWQGTLVGNGSNEVLAAALRALVPAGGTLVSLAPSFSMYPLLADRLGARLLAVPLAPPDFSAQRRALLDAAATADVLLLCSPNNPTGGELDAGVLEELLALGKPTLLDAAYAEFGSLDAIPLLRRHAHLLVLRSLSKAWGLAGLRVGALLASEEMVGRVAAEMLPFDTGWLPAAAYRAACEQRQAGAALVAEIVAERERVLAALRGVGAARVVPSRGNFYLLAVAARTGRELAASLAERGVAVRDIDELSAAGFVRVTVGTREENDALLAALGEVCRG